MNRETACLERLHTWMDGARSLVGVTSDESMRSRLDGLAETFPYGAVVDHYRTVGKHFVDEELLEALDEARELIERAAPSLPYHIGPERRGNGLKILVDFLETALDKHRECYDYKSYIALPLFLDDTMPASAPFETVVSRRLELATYLLLDTYVFEGRSLLGREPWTQDRRDDEVVRQRLTAVNRVLQSIATIPAESLGWSEAVRDAVDKLGVLHRDEPDDDQIARATDLCAMVLDQCRWDPVVPMELILRASMLPVYTNHDEYFFIRVLQAFESMFNVLVHGLQAVGAQIYGGRITAAQQTLETLCEVFRPSPPMLRLLMTMEVENFRIFRQFTVGASAIQSPQFKLIEVLMGAPSAERLASPAFSYTPQIRALYERLGVGLDETIGEYARQQWGLDDLRDVTDPEMLAMLRTLNELDRALVTWKKSHFGIARHMIGSEIGTGGFDVIQYLSRFRAELFFPELEALNHKRLTA